MGDQLPNEIYVFKENGVFICDFCHTMLLKVLESPMRFVCDECYSDGKKIRITMWD